MDQFNQPPSNDEVLNYLKLKNLAGDVARCRKQFEDDPTIERALVLQNMQQEYKIFKAQVAKLSVVKK